MNSREFDGMLDDLLRQAMYPFAETEPPAKVWRRVLCTVRLLCAGTPTPIRLLMPAGLVSAFSHWLGFFSGMKVSNVFSHQPYYADPSGRYLSSPFWDIALKQMFDLRLAS